MTDISNLRSGTGGFARPEKIIANLEVKEGMKIADFGCGHGYFSIPAAKLVGLSGIIYALDILKEALEAVSSRAKIEGLTNIQCIWANLELVGGARLPNDAVDMVFMHNVLFQTQKKSEIIKEALRVLKAGGNLVIIDWLAENKDIGPQEGYKVSVEEVKKIANDMGMVFDKNIDVDAHHFGLIFKK